MAIYKIWASRVNNAEANEYEGDLGLIWYDETSGNIRLYDGSPGGRVINGSGGGGDYGNANVVSLLADLGSNIIASTGNITTIANISGNYVLGNGRFLSGIESSGGLANGTSNIDIPIENGNAVVTIAGTANSAVFGENFLAIGGAFSTPKTINANVRVANAVNAIAISPLTVEESGNIIVPDDATFTIWTPA